MYLQVEDYRFQCDELQAKLEAALSSPPSIDGTDLEEKVRMLEEEMLQLRNEGQSKTEALQQDLTSATEKLNEQKKK